MPKKEKSKPDLKKWIMTQYVGNFIGVAIVTSIFIKLIFIDLSGLEGGLNVILGFMLIYIPFFSLVLPFGNIVNSRRDFLRGKLVIGNTPAEIKIESLMNPWRRLGMIGLFAAMGITLFICFAFKYWGEWPVSLLWISIIAFTGTLIPSTLIIRLNLSRDVVSFAGALSESRQDQPEPFWRYFFFEHAANMIFLQWVLNMGIGFMIYNKEAIKAGGYVPSNIVVSDIGIMVFFIGFFMWLSSQAQVRGDVHLGRIEKTDKKGLATTLMIMVIILKAVIASVIVAGILFSAKIDHVSITTALAIKTAFAFYITTAGCWLGVWWGQHKESDLIREQQGISVGQKAVA